MSPSNATPAPTRDYLLADGPAEQRRLQAQADLVRDLTHTVMLRAGIAPGMRVLDVGSGLGDVAFLVADLVGPQGEVVGIDVNPDSVALAQERGAAAGRANVHFAAGDLNTVGIAPFDAVVGRLVLMYQPDPVASLRHLARQVVPGGVMAFQEADFTFFAHAEPAVETVTRTHDWIAATFAAAGTDLHVGFRLRRWFAAAGLPAPRLQFDALIGGGDDFTGYHYAQETVRSMLPAMQALGVATAEEVDVDSLGRRMREEVVAADATLLTLSLVGGWCTLP